MKKMNKKGFTIVELTIVIAVIAILAAVLIPTFSGVITKAKLSAAEQAATSVYKEVYALDLADGKLDGLDSGTAIESSKMTNGTTTGQTAHFVYNLDSNGNPVFYYNDGNYIIRYKDGVWSPCKISASGNSVTYEDSSIASEWSSISAPATSATKKAS